MNKAKEIGIVICNYNKKDYVLKCIESVLNQTFVNFDLIVVDNASTDDSAYYINKHFENKVELIVNQENLGGAGGFNTGMKKCLERDYKYVMLLDNDVVLDDDAVKELYSFMELHTDVGMAGSKILKMDEPDKIMAMGSKVNYKEYKFEDNFSGYINDLEVVPQYVTCDYVPACSLMVRMEVLQKVGIMPGENFIYWDDIEWGEKIKRAGYKIICCGNSKVWHKGGGKKVTNTFAKYYIWRNKIKFFLKFLPDDKLEEFIEHVLRQQSQMTYGSLYKKRVNVMNTINYAIDDALHGVYGKADDYKILSIDSEKSAFQLFLESREEIFLSIEKDFYLEDYFLKDFIYMIELIREINNNIKIYVDEKNFTSDMQCEVKRNFKEICFTGSMDNMCKLIFCKHALKKYDRENAGDIYIDKYQNINQFNSDLEYSKNQKVFENLYIESKCQLYFNLAKRLRREYLMGE